MSCDASGEHERITMILVTHDVDERCSLPTAWCHAGAAGADWKVVKVWAATPAQPQRRRIRRLRDEILAALQRTARRGCCA